MFLSVTRAGLGRVVRFKNNFLEYRGFIPKGDRVLSYNIIVVANRH